MRSGPSSSVRKLTYVPPVEKDRISVQAVAGPLNVRPVFLGLFPRARYVEHIVRIAIADGRVLFGEAVQGPFDLEQDHGRMARSDSGRMLDDLLAQGRFDAREVLALPVVAPALRLSGVEQRLELHIRPAHQHVADRVCQTP